MYFVSPVFGNSGWLGRLIGMDPKALDTGLIPRLQCHEVISNPNVCAEEFSHPHLHSQHIKELKSGQITLLF